ncbi:hypothetical protein GDO78_015940 [Eleutherodactylus coqui]|uniref:Secreted protein n=1 Tax=Eleutherodactylus coqui TaxID=57060 RepID=A0A8J6JW27_ELECQ|nr:hypothetical protein GDO78_015940 [Eleutherodactylus coqui]
MDFKLTLGLMSMACVDSVQGIQHCLRPVSPAYLHFPGSSIHTDLSTSGFTVLCIVLTAHRPTCAVQFWGGVSVCFFVF